MKREHLNSGLLLLAETSDGEATATMRVAPPIHGELSTPEVVHISRSHGDTTTYCLLQSTVPAHG